VIVVEAAAMKEAEAAASAGSQQPTVAYIKVSNVSTPSFHLCLR